MLARPRAGGAPQTHPDNEEIEQYTDHYFNRTKRVIGKFGDQRVTYAIFMRRPVICTPRLAVEWLQMVARERRTAFDVDLRYREGHSPQEIARRFGRTSEAIRASLSPESSFDGDECLFF